MIPDRLVRLRKKVEKPNSIRDASKSFGDQLLEFVLPELVIKFDAPIIKKATIAENGDLTTGFEYLRDYLEGR